MFQLRSCREKELVESQRQLQNQELEDLKNKVLFERLLKAASSGVIQAQVTLALTYLEKGSSRFDPAMAVYWLNAAANEGDTQAQQILSELQLRGQMPSKQMHKSA